MRRNPVPLIRDPVSPARNPAKDQAGPQPATSPRSMSSCSISQSSQPRRFSIHHRRSSRWLWQPVILSALATSSRTVERGILPPPSCPQSHGEPQRHQQHGRERQRAGISTSQATSLQAPVHLTHTPRPRSLCAATVLLGSGTGHHHSGGGLPKAFFRQSRTAGRWPAGPDPAALSDNLPAGQLALSRSRSGT